MGYTHYWTQTKDNTRPEWEAILDNVKKIIKAGKVPLANWEGIKGTSPELNMVAISLNGSGEDSHETFHIPRIRDKQEAWQKRAKMKKGWAFCKTAYKPYDKVVVACLCYLADAGVLTSSSDGGPEDWTEGLELARSALARPALQIPEGVKENA